MIGEQMLGPKELHEKMTCLPKVTLDNNVKVRKNYSPKEVDADVEKTEVIPKHFDDVHS